MTVVGITHTSEMFPTKQRGAYQSLIMTIGLFGIPVTAYVARFTIPLASWAWRLASQFPVASETCGQGSPPGPCRFGGTEGGDKDVDFGPVTAAGPQ